MKHSVILTLLFVSSIARGQAVDTSGTTTSILSNLNNGVDGATQIQMTDLKQTEVDLPILAF